MYYCIIEIKENYVVLHIIGIGIDIIDLVVYSSCTCLADGGWIQLLNLDVRADRCPQSTKSLLYVPLFIS